LKKRDKKFRKKERFSHIRKIYDALAVKDMSFADFERAYKRETSVQNNKRELKELVRFRSYQRTQRMVAAQSKNQIDQRISEN